jgi:hypothetical protein
VAITTTIESVSDYFSNYKGVMNIRLFLFTFAQGGRVRIGNAREEATKIICAGGGSFVVK